MPERPSRVKRYLASAPDAIFISYAVSTAFLTYFCMYAFRKPFTAATYEGLQLDLSSILPDGISSLLASPLLDLKTVFVLSQLIGYTISKYIGVKICSEITRSRRAGALLACILFAELMLLLFAVLPNEWKILAIFLNGLPLGMVWGLVVWYLEGRRSSELLLAGLSCSYIVASSSVKVVAAWLMGAGVSEFWMPVCTGAAFLPLFVIATFLLDRLPEPTKEDIAVRVERQPMRGPERKAFVRRFLPGLAMLFVLYFFLTAYRDFRDIYMPEIFTGLGYGNEPTLFGKADWPVALGVLAALAAINLIRHNRRALLAIFVLMTIGMLMMAGSTLLLDMGLISGLWWMILVGLGAYLAYVPYGSLLFDRLIASSRYAGTAVFAIYLSDALGYTGSVFLQLFKDLFQPDMSRFEFFRLFTLFMAAFGALLFITSGWYFYRQARSK